MEKYIFIFFFSFSFLVIFFYKNKITKKLGILDKPDKIRKLHKKNTSTIAGILLGIIIIPFILLFKDLYQANNYLLFFSITYVILLGISGIFDDIKSIKANKKFIIFISSNLFFGSFKSKSYSRANIF